ncbi:MAG: hypothetical protein KDE54_09395 [Caldilineaceae bacterium]|nr:hypothetical protein [Caldilineaceae bacterium]MCB0139965.1 hypothetical protein [Caldilineaceae bacterium]
MPILHVKLFGLLAIEGNAQSPIELSSKAQELFAYLLIFRDRGHTREALADLLWPEASNALAQKYLRQTLWQLQSALEAVPASSQSTPPQILLCPGWIRLNPQASLWADLIIFEDAFKSINNVPAHEWTPEMASQVEEALLLYQGDLLETWYQDWCLYERERFQLTYLAMLDKLMSYCEAQQHYERGIAYGRLILRYDRARESTYRQLMRLYYLSGDRTTALHEYERCVAALQTELEIEPTEKTVALYEQIRADKLEPFGLPLLNTQLHRMPSLAPEKLELHERLHHLNQLFVTFQRQVHQELYQILTALNG